jgi:hypothetical protein
MTAQRRARLESLLSAGVGSLLVKALGHQLAHHVLLHHLQCSGAVNRY